MKYRRLVIKARIHCGHLTNEQISEELYPNMYNSRDEYKDCDYQLMLSQMVDYVMWCDVHIPHHTAKKLRALVRKCKKKAREDRAWWNLG